MHTKRLVPFALLTLALAPLCPTQAQTAAPQAITKTTLTVLHSFSSHPSETPLIIGADGAFYGVIGFGGADNAGTVFKVTKGGLFHNLANLYKKNGNQPSGPLLLMPDGSLMGTALEGGKSGTGALFLLTPPHRFQTKHEFAAVGPGARNTRGAVPQGALALGADGAVYGTTLNGGAYGRGVAYRWTAAHGVEVLHDFVDAAEGTYPSGLTLGPGGALYGATQYGGPHNLGTVFRITTEGVFTVLHMFDTNSNAAYPQAPPISGKDGALYGVTNSPPAAYRITPDGDYTLLHTFTYNTEGYGTNGLTLAPDGSFYGNNDGGGPNFGYGTIFHMSTDGHVTLLYTFHALNTGHFPIGLTLAPDGALYGITASNGANGSGTIFKLRLPH